MYRQYFGLTEKPFSLTPDPRFLYLSAVHEEALAHLLYGVSEGGGIVLLTGEVGTGKTAMCRCLLNQLPDNVDLALILNPKLTPAELVASICEELEIDFPRGTGSLKVLVDRPGAHLRDAHARGRNSVVMIDEAQNLTPELIEQLRLLTNLETEKKKLLQIILVAQPELNDLLARADMRQVFQRITARFHLRPLDRNDTRAYIRHRLAVAGVTAPLFDPGAMTVIHKVSGGIPRLINSLCDRCLLAAYADNRKTIDRKAAESAVFEVFGGTLRVPRRRVLPWAGAAGLAAGLAFLIAGPVNLTPAVEALESFATVWFDGESRDAAGPPDAAAAQAEVVAPPAPAPPPQEQAVEDPLLPDEAEVLETSAPPEIEITRPLSVDPLQAVAGEAAAPPPVALEPTPEPASDRETPAAAEPVQTAVLSLPRIPETVPPAAPEQVKLEDLFQGGGASREETFTHLFEAWSSDYASLAGAEPCRKAQSAGLACLEEKGPWRRLERLNRPALIALYNAEGKELHAVVRAIDGDRVTLDVAGRRVAAERKRLIYYWSGKYVILWRPPEPYRRVMTRGQRGEDIAWLRARLADVLGLPAGTGAAAFDAELEELVMTFQRSRYLKEDGVVGPRTLIHINTAAADPAIPLLKQP
jgi:general secretion pathway protein A